MVNFIKRLFCHHKWGHSDFNEFETGMGTDDYVKCIGETAVCSKCGKKVFSWVKEPFSARTFW